MPANPAPARLLTLLLVLALGPPAGAADAHGLFMVKGAGTTQCRDFAEAARERGAELVSYAGWLEGYLSAMNRYEEGVYDLVSWHSTELLLASLARFCASNPDAGFHDAVNRLAGRLRQTAIQERSQIVAVPVGEGEQTLVLYAAVIERIQRRLRARELYEGAITGELDDDTREALARFQEEKELPATGLPDQATLTHLLP
jgi:hypothetical protein